MKNSVKNWLEALKIYSDSRMITILFLGFSSGLPLLLVFSTLTYWLKDEGISKTAIGLFSLVRTPYGLKFLWAPFIDRLRIPVLDNLLGRRRSWAVVTQVALMLSIIGMALTQPAINPYMTALFAVFVAFCSASQDVVIDAYRIEILEESEQGAGAAMIVLGYRIGMLFAGAGALCIASSFSWNFVYMLMAAAVAVGILTILLSHEPKTSAESKKLHTDEDLKIVFNRFPKLTKAQAKVGAFMLSAVVRPFADFMKRPNWHLILMFIMLYKLCETYLGAMVNPFYVEMGFSKEEIAAVIKIFGMGATIFGGICGGIMVHRYGVMKSLLIGGILQGLANLMYAVQAVVGHDIHMLMLTISIENVTAGMATTAFVAYLSGLCSVAYTATQYALLTSLMALSRDVISSTSGFIADKVDWVTFFIITALCALPGIFLLLYMMKKLTLEEKVSKETQLAEEAT